MTPGQSERIELVGKYSAALSVIEVALGSVLHSVHLPLVGNFLSLNQGFLLCRGSIEAKSRGLKPVGYSISNVAAVLKSLAPAGKKLGPMLSLSAQGLLFALGEGALGANLAGWMLGMALLSLWTFVQPIVTYYLFFGSDLFSALHYLFDRTLPYHGISLGDLAWLLAAVVVLKMAAGAGLAWVAWRTQGRAGFQEKLLRLAAEQGARPIDGVALSRRAALWLSFRDLFRPLFLLSLAATACFLFFSEHSAAQRFWILLRPVAIGFIFFYFSRTLTLDRWLARLQGTRAEGFALACQSALAELRRFGRSPGTGHGSS